MKFIDRHNGWGLSALHIAVFQGSVSTGGNYVTGSHVHWGLSVSLEGCRLYGSPWAYQHSSTRL